LHKSTAVAVFTEHFNATYHINFLAPLSIGAEGVHLRSMSADQLAACPDTELRAWLGNSPAGPAVQSVILSRVIGPHAHRLVSVCEDLGLPVHFHLDDWLFDLPVDLGSAYTERYDQVYAEQLESIVRRVGNLLCSSASLRHQACERFPTLRIQQSPGVCYTPYPGAQPAIKARAARLRRQLLGIRGPTIGYAGSRSHARDIALLTPALDQLMHEHESLRFECFGLPVPELLARHWPDRVASFGYTTDYPSYLKALYELGWSLGLAPLVDDMFNRCKTPTKLVEYTACGIPALCSDVTPYREMLGEVAPRALVVADGWYEAMRQHLQQAALRRQNLLSSREVMARRVSTAKAGPELLRLIDSQAVSALGGVQR